MSPNLRNRCRHLALTPSVLLGGPLPTRLVRSTALLVVRIWLDKGWRIARIVVSNTLLQRLNLGAQLTDDRFQLTDSGIQCYVLRFQLGDPFLCFDAPFLARRNFFTPSLNCYD